jgi:hypothetical protein
VLGALTLLLLSRDSPQGIAMLSALIVGLGMGFTTSALIISVQNAVEWRHRGVATASTQFFRTIGGSISIAIMGAILNSQMRGRLAEVPGVPEGATAETLLNIEERAQLSAPVLDGMQRALASSLHEIFFFVVLSAVVSFLVVLFFPRGRHQDLAVGATPVPAAEAPPPGEADRRVVPDEGA